MEFPSPVDGLFDKGLLGTSFLDNCFQMKECLMPGYKAESCYAVGAHTNR